MVEIKRCTTRSDYASAVQVVKDYLVWLDMDLSFQDLETELSGFSSMYGEPHGLFLLARRADRVAGGVGLRRLEAGVCEMKRLFVYERFRKLGVGRELCVRLIEEARRMGYTRMRLDTVARLKAANALYRRLGFVEIEPYRFNPDPTAGYMELRL